jgi:hypothetical protein
MTFHCSRRRFLRSSLATGAALTVLPAGLARSYAANERLNVALVGVAGRGSWFVDTIPRIGESVVALCDVNQRRAAEAFKRFPEVPKYDDFRIMLDERDREIDAVVVATPDNTHAVITAAAIRHGKHVYCEKPLTHAAFRAGGWPCRCTSARRCVCSSRTSSSARSRSRSNNDRCGEDRNQGGRE